MIIDLLRNVARSRRVRKPLPQKLQVLTTLNRFVLQKKFLNGKNEQVKVRFDGLTVHGFDYRTLDLLYREIFMDEQYKFVSNKSKPLIIDCGSNIGVAVLYFKKLFPESRIIAFEPNPHTFRLLEKNISVNNLKNVETHNKALWHEETVISFFIDENVGTLLGSVRKDRGGDHELKIRTEKLSDLLAQYDKVDMLKMDVEGAEINVIDDLKRNNMIQKADRYIIEYHHNISDDKSALSSFLKIFEDNGFNYVIKEYYTSPELFQDLLIYMYKPDTAPTYLPNP